MPFPAHISLRRDQLAHAIRQTSPDELRVLAYLLTISSESGQVCFAVQRAATELGFATSTITSALDRLVAFDVLERLPAWRHEVTTIEFGPIVVRSDAAPSNLPVEPI